jgi:hypothetical protein
LSGSLESPATNCGLIYIHWKPRSAHDAASESELPFPFAFFSCPFAFIGEGQPLHNRNVPEIKFA